MQTTCPSCGAICDTDDFLPGGEHYVRESGKIGGYCDYSLSQLNDDDLDYPDEEHDLGVLYDDLDDPDEPDLPHYWEDEGDPHTLVAKYEVHILDWYDRLKLMLFGHIEFNLELRFDQHPGTLLGHKPGHRVLGPVKKGDF